MSLSLMKQRVFQSGNNLRDETIRDAVFIAESDWESDPSYSTTIYRFDYNNIDENDTLARLRIYNKKYSSSSGITEQFQSLINNKVVLGDYFFDGSDNTYWICTESFNIDSIHYKGKLTQCNHNLYWQNSDGKIISRYAWVQNASAYNNGESGNSTITLQSNQYMVYLPYDEDTRLLDKHRIHMSRDIRKCKPYELTRLDDIAFGYGEKGLINLIFTQVQYNQDEDKLITLDNGKEVWICDYFSPAPPPTPPDETTDLSVSISGNTNLKIGYERTYTVVFKDLDGNVVNNADFEWNVVSGFDDKIEKTISGNRIKLKVEDDSLIGESFLLGTSVECAVLSVLTINVVEGF